MCLESDGKFDKYPDLLSIFNAWFEFRKRIYQLRRDYIMKELQSQLASLNLKLEYYQYYARYNTVSTDPKYDFAIKTRDFANISDTISSLESKLASIEHQISTLPSTTDMWLSDLSKLNV